MSAGAVARGQGAITAFQSVMGELVCAVAEQSERATVAEGEVTTLERRVRELERQLEERDTVAYRRGYSAGHKAGGRGASAEPPARPQLRAVGGAHAA